jgi:ubiquitin-activating enzyme E1 C
MAQAAVINSAASANSNWQDRYYHVDQVLENPGPRTDEAFTSGEPVSLSMYITG